MFQRGFTVELPGNVKVYYPNNTERHLLDINITRRCCLGFFIGLMETKLITKRMLNKMRLTPFDILCCLGFNMPPDGIEIEPNEARFYVEALCAIGVTLDVSAIPESVLGNLYDESIRMFAEAIDVSTIPDSFLCDLHAGFAKLILACQDSNASPKLDSDVKDWLCILIELKLGTIYRQRKKEWMADGGYILDSLACNCANAEQKP
jgi:hypothetical protein